VRVPVGVYVRVKELMLGVIVVLGVREVNVGVCVSLVSVSLMVHVRVPDGV